MRNVPQVLRALALALTTAFAVSCGSQPELPKIEGVAGPFFNVQNGRVLVSMTLEQVEIIGGVTIPLGKLQNSTVEVTPAQEGGTLFQVAVDLSDIELTDWSTVDPHSLPGGRPLPGIVGGQLPSFAVTVPQLADATVYASQKVFGFFLPFKLKVQAIATFRIVMNGKNLGNLSLVGQDSNGENSGLLVLMNLNAAGKKELKRLIKISKKAENRHKLY